ncbi:unnamed protein product [Hymenolepis diminuta]|uniref:Helix-turn-helix type 11 domain-containing protein n=1 Tax=Hymenolepis diminuta TaxID=6216 RepID=A0A564ZCF6_HYMDI|nr:unnamed protein product [Hymenolepis diminuta]
MLKKLNSVKLEVAIDANPTSNTRELSKTLNVSHKTIYRETERLSKVSRAEKLVPHDFSEINKQQCATCCVSLRSRNLNFRHLFRPNHN